MVSLLGEVVTFKCDVWEDGKLVTKAGDKSVIYYDDSEMGIVSFTNSLQEDMTISYEEIDQYLTFDNPQIDAWQQQWVEEERQIKGENDMEDMIMKPYICTKEDAYGLYNVGNPMHILDVDTDEGIVCIWHNPENEESFWMDLEEFRQHFTPQQKEITC